MTETRHWEWLGLALVLGATGPAALAQQPTSPAYPVYRVTNAPAPTAASPAAAATPVPPPSAPAQQSASELEKLAMPIALYPDPLISIILPAAAYPVEIVQAARFVKNTNNIPKIGEQPWDDNVKAVAEFPEVIAKMDADLGWTVDLGQAFMDQPKELMDAIQELRARAQKAGTLRTTEHQVVTVTNVVVVQTNVTQVVTVTNEIVQIQPANPQVIYVPTYPYTVYYPPPAYVYNPWAPLVTFGAGIAVGAIIANNCDWHHGGVYVGHHGAVVWGGGYHGDVNVNVKNTYNRNVNVNNPRTTVTSPSTRPANTQKWQPDQNRLRNSGAGGAGASAGTREARGWGSGATQPSTGNVGARPSTGNVGARPSTGAVGRPPSTGAAGARPSTGSVGARPSTGTTPSTRPASAPTAGRPAPSTSTWQSRPGPSSGGSAFSGVSSGSTARNYSSRGSSSAGSRSFSGSRGGFSGGRGGGRGGGRR